MKFVTRSTGLFFLVLVTGCNVHKTPSTDAEDNRFYSAYRDIYKGYNKIPIDSTSKQLENYLKEFPENANAWAFYGNTCFKSRNDSTAVLAYRNAILADESQANYYAGLGTVFNYRNELDSAEKYLLKATGLKDSSPFTPLNLSMLYLKKNDQGKSLAYADSAFYKGQTEPLVLAGLSFVYFVLNEPVKGNEKYNLAIQAGLKDTIDFRSVLNGEMKIEDYYRINSY